MRNLKNTNYSTLRLPAGLLLQATAWDSVTDTLVCAFGPSEDTSSISLRRWTKATSRQSPEEYLDITSDDADLQTIISWDVESSPKGSDSILCFHYFADDRSACLVLASGDIIVVRERPAPNEEEVEIVGSVDAGITAAEWSPDEGLLAISSQTNSLLFMTREFENAGETIMKPGDLTASRHVSVGWGKSETQFKGKRAKALQDPTIPVDIDEGSSSPFDTGQTEISWRGDGAFMAISKVDTGLRRVIRVYTRDGMLDSVTEPVNGLEKALAWRPAGNLLASVQRLTNQLNVVFFERNGLRHGQFCLRLSESDMNTWGSDISLKWNLDSTVLAVSFKDRVQLWTMSNYHYYLKQEVKTFPQYPEGQPSFVRWNPSVPLRIAVSLPGILKELEYAFTITSGSTVVPDDLGIVVVIDGCILKLTSLRAALLPPPMALCEIATQSPALDTAVDRSGSLIAVLCFDELHVFKWLPRARSHTNSLQHGKINIKNELQSTYSQQVVLVDDSIFVLGRGASESIVFQFLLVGTDLQFYGPVYQSMLSVLRIFASSDCETLCIENKENRVLECKKRELSLDVEFICQLPVPATWIEIVHLSEEALVFGLSYSGSLYANQRLLAKDCTSMLVTSTHLIFTTSRHLLKFVHLTNVDDLIIPADESYNDERCRNIERGGKLVSVMPSVFSVTLQMPRGNLETIYPRALVVAGIRQHIGNKDYRSAFYACRNRKIDLNILHDHAPEQFMSNLGLLVSQIDKVEHIDLFLSQLKEEDVTMTMYKETLPSSTLGRQEDSAVEMSRSGSNRLAAPLSTSKINKICDAMLALFALHLPNRLQNLITAHVCKSPPDLSSALQVIANLKAKSPELVERAVEHVCFLADVNQLYDQALGLYDIHLALTVAQQSQKDPREYLPFLQELQHMSPTRRHFSIDDHLGRHLKALSHLRSLDTFDEFKRYMVKHQLYQAGLSMYKYEPESFDEVMAAYAKHAESQSRFKEAGLAYEFVALYKDATEMYRAAGCWREALFCASQASMSELHIRELASALADSLYESKDYLNAANLYWEYGKNVEMAARTFCKGYFFAEAMRLIALHGDKLLLDIVIDQELVAGMASTTELLAECKGQINAQVPRLRELRTYKEKDPLAFFDGATETDVQDNISLAATDASISASLFTRYTNRTGSLNTNTSRRTSKNRRREERKRARGKKGSVYEEEYLVNSIRRLIDRVNSIRDDMGRLIEGLLRRKMWERATVVETAMKDIVNLCKRCISEVFEPTSENGVKKSDLENLADVDGALVDKPKESNSTGEAPFVMSFETLTLMGS